MKYLTYILSSPVQPDTFIPDKPILKEAAVIVVIPAAVVGLFFVACMIPGAAGMDGIRLIRLMAHRRNKRANLRRYATNVIISLGHEPTEEKINLLIAA